MEGGREPDNVKAEPMISKTRARLPMTTIVKVKFGPQNGFQHTLEIPFQCDNDITADFL